MGIRQMWAVPRCQHGGTIGWVGWCGKAGGRGGRCVSVVRHESWIGGLGKGMVGGGADGAE